VRIITEPSGPGSTPETLVPAVIGSSAEVRLSRRCCPDLTSQAASAPYSVIDPI
jgi:hypothetical protein